MLKWPPPIETGRLDCASAARTSSAYLGTTTDDTATGLSRVTSLTITCGGSGRFMDAHLQVIAGAAARVLAVPVVAVRAARKQQLAREDDGAKHRYQRQQQPPCGKLPVVQASHRQRKQHGKEWRIQHQRARETGDGLQRLEQDHEHGRGNGERRKAALLAVATAGLPLSLSGSTVPAGDPCNLR